MRTPVWGSFVTLALITSAVAVGGPTHWKKPYFTATKPGSFVRLQSVDAVTGDIDESVLTRLADEDGHVVFERRSEYKTGKFKGTKFVNRHVMKSGFPMEMEGLSYERWVEKLQVGMGDGPLNENDAETVNNIASGGVDYGAIAVFKGTETIGGKACDHYAYSYDRKGLGKVEGELWLSDQVPFAAVKQTLRGKDATGAAYRFETKLVETGLSAAAATPAPVTFTDLFRGGKISIVVEVVPKSSRVQLTITNKGEAKLKVVVPKGITTLEVGSPVDTLVLVADAERALEIPAHGTAPRFDLTQKGAYRPTKGTFTVSVFEGQPLFSGSVEMDHVKN